MRQTKPRIGRPPCLSRDIIVAAALDSDLRTLTMRDLAAKLDVSHSALYRWVADREGLFHLISDVMVERVLPTTAPTSRDWREWLTKLAWSMHDEFLAVPGYAEHVARPHNHNPHSFALLHTRVVEAFRAAGASAEMAEHSWYIFGMGVVEWLGARQSGHEVSDLEPRFDLFLDVLLRGLPARELS